MTAKLLHLATYQKGHANPAIGDPILNLLDTLPGIFYQIQFDTSQEGMAAWQFKFISQGVTELCGLPPKAVLASAKSLLSRIHPDDVDDVLRSSARAATEQRQWVSEFRLLDKFDRYVWVESIDNSTVTDDGLMFCSGHLKNIDLRKVEDVKRRKLSDLIDSTNQQLLDHIRLQTELTEQTEQALLEERSLVDEQQMFLRMVAHEFRTPLTVIRSACDLAHLQLMQNPAATESSLHKIQQAVWRMERLIESSLCPDRVESLTQQHRLHRHSIPKLMQEIAEYAQLIAPESHELIFQTDDFTHRLDPELCRVMLHNLIDNAIKYSPTGGTINVNVRSRNGDCIITVKDNGIGLHNQNPTELFTKYKRGDHDHLPGLGLGLYLVERIVLFHQGSVQFVPQPEGTLVQVVLPG